MALSGRFRSALIIGGQGIRARKLRTLLSMLSLFLGVLAIVTVQAGAEIGKRALLSDVELQMGRDGTRQMFIPGAKDAVLDVLRGRTDVVGMYSAQATIGEPGVRALNEGGAPFNEDGTPMGGGAGPEKSFVHCDNTGCFPVQVDGPAAPRGQAIEVRLVALTGDVRAFRPYRLESGGWLDFTGDPSLSPRLVLNEQAARGFANNPVPAEMRIDGATANSTPRILGVVDDAGYEPVAYVRADELAAWLPTSATGNNDRYGGGMEILMTPDSSAVERVLRSRLTGAGVPADNIHVETIRSNDSRKDELALLHAIFLGMAGLVLLIGVAGILNVGLATVGERVEEFALRRALGTPRSLLAGIVLAETLLTGLLTAGAAIAAGILGLEAIGVVLGGREPFLQDLTFPWQAGVAGVIAGLVAGLLGGLIPAIRAARIPIATVMRA